jgi:hypothetical protein
MDVNSRGRYKSTDLPDSGFDWHSSSEYSENRRGSKQSEVSGVYVSSHTLLYICGKILPASVNSDQSEILERFHGAEPVYI